MDCSTESMELAMAAQNVVVDARDFKSILSQQDQLRFGNDEFLTYLLGQFIEQIYDEIPIFHLPTLCSSLYPPLLHAVCAFGALVDPSEEVQAFGTRLLVELPRSLQTLIIARFPTDLVQLGQACFIAEYMYAYTGTEVCPDL